MKKQNCYPILSFTLEKFTDFLNDNFGKSEYYAKSIYKEFYREGKTNFSKLSEFSTKYRLPKISISNKISTADDVIKFGLTLEDSFVIESVIIPHQNHNTLCISSQVGCRMGCKFCSTGDMGFVRNLSTQEILFQVFVAKFELKYPIGNIVFMGMGEPLDNCESVFDAIRILKEPFGFAIPKRKITISTSGHIQGLQKLAKSDIFDVSKAISLHFADQKKRKQYMPIANKNGLSDLHKTLNEFPVSNRKMFFIEYIMLKGINDSDSDAEKLTEYLSGLPVKINLIAYNSGLETAFEPSSPTRISKFQDILMKAGFVVIFRNSRGANIQAACGQLSNQY